MAMRARSFCLKPSLFSNFIIFSHLLLVFSTRSTSVETYFEEIKSIRNKMLVSTPRNTNTYILIKNICMKTSILIFKYNFNNSIFLSCKLAQILSLGDIHFYSDPLQRAHEDTFEDCSQQV